MTDTDDNKFQAVEDHIFQVDIETLTRIGAPEDNRAYDDSEDCAQLDEDSLWRGRVEKNFPLLRIDPATMLALGPVAKSRKHRKKNKG